MSNPAVALQQDRDAHDYEEEESDQSDQAARQQAARHRNEASILVRNHLENHVVHNPGGSSDYVTWIATLHPENADITIDQRFFIPGNPWWTIYEESKNNDNQIPTVTAVRVPDDVEEGGIRDDRQQQQQTDDNEENQSPDNKNKMPSCWKTCSPFGILFGISISVPTIVLVLCLEMLALFIFYFPSVVFFHTARAFSPPNCCTCLFYGVFLLLYSVFSFVDSILLLVSILVAESLAIVASILGFITGGIIWSHYLHQHIRRLCHGVRIVFRKNSSCCCCGRQNINPSRVNCYNEEEVTTGNDDKDNDMDNNDNNDVGNDDNDDDNIDGGNGIVNNNNDHSKSNDNVYLEPIVAVAV